MQTRPYLALALVGLLILAARAVAGGQATADRPAISPEARAATLRLGDGVAPGDRAWIHAAIAGARPEARRLIAEVDGLVEIRSDLDAQGAIGLARLEGDHAVVSLDVRALDGERALDRGVVVLHELGHVVDAVLLTDELRRRLDAGIPRVGTCSSWAAEPTGACTAVAERFADTFAKWALHGRFSLAGSGYGIPMPASIEDWGAPLGLLAAGLPTTRAGSG
jgi:hypothetical protein